MPRRIIYFDGYCNLCNGLVSFVLRHDRRGRFVFATLQGATARARLGERFTTDPETVVLEDPSRFRLRSDAALAILSGLGGVWRLTDALRMVPRPIRDAAYNYVARKRFGWFGRRASCRTPEPDEGDRFLP